MPEQMRAKTNAGQNRCRMGGYTRKKENAMNRFFSQPDTENVVSMNRFRSGKTLSPIHQAEAYWSALRTGMAVPRRSRIDPRGLENILEYTFILERIAPGIARFRLAGQHLNDLAGMEVRGMPLTTFFTAPARSQISAVLEHVFDTPSVGELTLTGTPARARTPVEARMILLPLESDLGDVNRALGVLICDNASGLSGHAPIRFDLTKSALRSVNGTRNTPVSAPLDDRDQPRLRLV